MSLGALSSTAALIAEGGEMGRSVMFTYLQGDWKYAALPR